MILSSAEASLCCRGTGEKEKESARGTMGRGKKEERPLPYNYSFPYNVVYLKCMTTRLLSWVPEVFSRVRRGALFRRAQTDVFGRRLNNASGEARGHYLRLD